MAGFFFENVEQVGEPAIDTQNEIILTGKHLYYIDQSTKKATVDQDIELKQSGGEYEATLNVDIKPKAKIFDNDAFHGTVLKTDIYLTPTEYESVYKYNPGQ